MAVVAVSHVHSSWSYDGSWALADLTAAFSGRGCRVMMTTEHDRGFSAARLAEYREACIKCSSHRLFVLPGLEYSDADNRVHVLVWGPVPFLGEGVPTDEILEAVAGYGGVAVLAHPERRNAWESFRPAWQRRLLGVEVWNRKYDGWAPSVHAAGLVNRTGRIPFVGLDFHTRRQFFRLAMTLGLDEGPLSEDQIVAALRAGRCAPTAFGLPLGGARFERRLPYLRVAEQGRRGLSRMKRRTQARLAR